MRRAWLGLIPCVALAVPVGAQDARPPQSPRRPPVADESRQPLRAVTLAEAPVAWVRPPGIRLEAIPAELRAHFGAPADRGVLVTRVDDQGLAGQLGLAVGDVVVEVDGQPIRAPQDLLVRLTIWRAGRSLSAGIVRAGEPRELTLSQAPPRMPTAVRTGLSNTQRDALRRQIEMEIDRLESRIGVLRARLARLKDEARESDADREP